MTYRDQHGRTLEEYPRPSVAVDTAVLTLSGSRLCALLVHDSDDRVTGTGEWRLPGTFLHSGERLADAALRALREKAGVDGVLPRQLHVFDDPKRDDRGWVISVAHYDVVPNMRAEGRGRRLIATDALPPLKYDHAEIIRFAVAALRAGYQGLPDPAQLLAESFTLRELRAAHEAVLGETLLPDTFRRAMLPALDATGELRREGLGRPAELYRRAS